MTNFCVHMDSLIGSTNISNSFHTEDLCNDEEVINPELFTW